MGFVNCPTLPALFLSLRFGILLKYASFFAPINHVLLEIRRFLVLMSSTRPVWVPGKCKLASGDTDPAKKTDSFPCFYVNNVAQATRLMTESLFLAFVAL